MQDLVEKAEQALELAARAGAGAVEVYVIDAPADAVSFEPDASAETETRTTPGSATATGSAGSSGHLEPRLETAVTVPHRGLSLSAQWGDRTGFASTTDLSDAALAEAVAECRRVAVPTAHLLPLTPPSTGPKSDGPSTRFVAGLSDSHILEMDLPDLVEVAREIVEETQDAGAGALAVVAMARCRRVAVANSLGLARSSLDTLISASVYAATAAGGLAGWSRSSRSLEGFRSLAVGRKAAALAEASDQPRDVVPGRQTVILRPDAVLSLLSSSFGPALGADRVADGGSPLGSSLGDIVASPILSITDDATRPGGTGSYVFDAEGTPARVTPVIDKGRLVSLLSNNRTAAASAAAGPASADTEVPAGLALARSTGNASRDRSDRMTTFVEPSGHFGYSPGVAPSNLVVNAPGATYPTFADAGIDRGLLVSDVMGAFVIDPAVGDFSVTTTNAWAIERGAVAYPVRRAMLTGNVYSLLRQVAALVEDPEDVNGQFALFTPSWVVDDVTVV